MLTLPRLTALALLVAGFSLASPLPAVTVDDLGSALVPVTDNSSGEQTRGVSSAFDRVIIKLTGDSRSLANPGLKGLRKQAKQFNTLFGYERGRDGTLLLRADFDVPALGEALRGVGFQVWGRERPDAQAWLMVEDAAGRRLMPSDEATREIFDNFARFASNRGIPIRLAAGEPELEAMLALARDDEALFESILAASGDAPVLLALLLRQDPAEGEAPPTWTLHWRTLIEGAAQTGKAQGELPVPVLETGLDAALDTVGLHFMQAVAEGGGTAEFDLTVAGVTSPQAYLRAVKYLEGLDTLKELSLLKAEGELLHFRVVAHGGAPAFAQAVGFGQVLRTDPAAPGRYRVIASP